MFRIIRKQELAPSIYLMVIEARRVAQTAQPGQFVIVRVHDHGERIPLTIADYDRTAGYVTIVTQAIGASTHRICQLNQGDALLDFVGPLGRPSVLVDMPDEQLAQRAIVFVGGGVGAAPIYPQVKYLAERGYPADVIIGAKSRNYEIMRPELEAVAAHYYQATDDGSDGFHGLVTDCLRDLVLNHGRRYTHAVTIGPMIMMKFVSALTKELGIPTEASLNTLMVDATGMCGACRVSVGGEMKFTCVDGPEFDAHAINFDEAMRRQGMYRTLENESLQAFCNNQK